ncbi:type I restriction endonuclease [Comamonas jiangduensis]|uniref:type I restriction endonuclease n=1 Tax=Comamonas jiangduensis TaxID=1194168 RepID=UPI0028ACA709|nr:type I restriction endonuclease [Comamonas jiangduensis]
MEIVEKLNALSTKLQSIQATIQTEEATKNALVMPFIQSVLGYDVFDPHEVVPEFTCDVGTKKGEKIDYAILKNDEVQILIECKKLGETLNVNHASQLFRYFHVTTARISILTNGRHYKFFTDLDAVNKMDEKPFLELDLLDLDEHVIPELAKLTKTAFDLESIINSAEELKYISQIKKQLANEFTLPSEALVKLICARVYDGIVTQKVRDQFTALTRKAMVQFLNDQINDRLKNALHGTSPALLAPAAAHTPAQAPTLAPSEASGDADGDHTVETTLEELEGFHIVRAIVRKVIDVKRVHYRDTQSYFGILVDDNNRRPICRLHFNRSQKYIGLMDEHRVEKRHPINGLDDIYAFTTALRNAAKQYTEESIETP